MRSFIEDEWKYTSDQKDFYYHTNVVWCLFVSWKFKCNQQTNGGWRRHGWVHRSPTSSSHRGRNCLPGENKYLFIFPHYLELKKPLGWTVKHVPAPWTSQTQTGIQSHWCEGRSPSDLIHPLRTISLCTHACGLLAKQKLQPYVFTLGAFKLCSFKY